MEILSLEALSRKFQQDRQKTTTQKKGLPADKVLKALPDPLCDRQKILYMMLILLTPTPDRDR